MNLFEIEKDDIHSKFSDFFLFHSILGFGSFGVVVAATSKSTKEECAVKVFFIYSSFLKKLTINFNLRSFPKKVLTQRN